MKEKIPTLILRILAVVFAAGGIGTVIGLFVWAPFGKYVPEYYNYLHTPLVIGVFAAVVCFLWALLQFWFLLNGLDKDMTFYSKHLKAIRLSAVVFSILYFLTAMPVMFFVAEAHDAPGLIFITAFIGTFPIGIAAVAAILERIAVDKF